MALTWSDMEAKFRKLEDDLPYTRVDAHWGGSDGEQWQLAGPSDPGPKQRFETVARLAGNKLRGELSDHPDIPDAVLNETDPVVRWYKAIWKLVGGFRFDYRDQPKADGGPTSAGSMKNIVKASYSTCILLRREFGEKEAAPAPAPAAKGGLLDSVRSIFSKKK
jgi:hypothetical protein